MHKTYFQQISGTRYNMTNYIHHAVHEVSICPDSGHCWVTDFSCSVNTRQVPVVSWWVNIFSIYVVFSFIFSNILCSEAYFFRY